MKVALPREMVDDYLMSRSVMDPPRNAFQQLTDFLFGRTYPEQATNAFTSLMPLRIGVLPGRERIASNIIKRGLKEPWFHGTQTPESILKGRRIIPEIDWFKTPVEVPLPRLGRPGFDPSRIGSTHGLRLGEPSGVSLTRSPEVARSFGDVLRVGVDIPPSSVGQFVDPEFQKLLRGSYEFATQTPTAVAVAKRTGPPAPALQVMGGPSDIAHFSTPAYKEAGWQIQPGKTFQNLFLQGVSPHELPQWSIPEFNKAMSEYLRAAGVEGIAYSPRRWGEYELRVLDPNKAVPLGPLDIPVGGYTPTSGYGSLTPGVMERYLWGKPTVPPDVRGKMGQLYELYRNAPEFPSRLRHVLEGTLAD